MSVELYLSRVRDRGSNRPRVLYIAPRGHTRIAFNDDIYARLISVFEVTANDSEEGYTTERVAAEIGDYEALLTGYKTPQLTAEVFERANRLSVIVHSAGSLKKFISSDVVDNHLRPRGIRVADAKGAIAFNVAEAVLGAIIMVRRQLLESVNAMRQGALWRDMSAFWNTETLNGSTVGIFGASKVGREFARLLEPFAVRRIVVDDHLDPWEAGALGLELVSLEDLFSSSDIVSLHAPDTSETRGIVDSRLLGLMKPGALLVNSARGPIIDSEALIKSCEAGRIAAILDVSDPEPLPIGSPLRSMPNVFITPHIMGPGRYGYWKMGEMALEALEDHFSCRPMRHEVDLSRFSRLA